MSDLGPVEQQTSAAMQQAVKTQLGMLEDAKKQEEAKTKAFELKKKFREVELAIQKETVIKQLEQKKKEVASKRIQGELRKHFWSDGSLHLCMLFRNVGEFQIIQNWRCRDSSRRNCGPQSSVRFWRFRA